MYWNVISDRSEKHTIFYKIVLLIIWLFDVHFAIQGLKMAKTKESSRDMRDRIIECHKGGQGYQKISKEMNLALSTVGNIVRKYKKYGNSTANLKKWKTEKNRPKWRISNIKASICRVWLWSDSFPQIYSAGIDGGYPQTLSCLPL